MKSIKTKILVSMVALITIVAVFIGGISSFLSYRSTLDTLETTLAELATTAAGQVKAEMNVYKTIAIDMGCMARLSNPATTQAEKIEIYRERIKTYNLKDVYSAGPTGTVDTKPSRNVANEAFFQSAIKGEAFVADPKVNEASGGMEIFVAAPLWAGGVANTQVIGVVVLTFDGLLLSEISDSVYTGDAGAAYIIDREGDTIAHQDRNLVQTVANRIENNANDSEMKDLVNLEKKMIAGETGFGAYTYGGNDKFLSYAPIPGSNGWSIGVNVLQDAYTGSTTRAILIIIAIAVAMILVGSFVSLSMANMIANPIKACAQRLNLLSQGDLKTEVPTTKAKDETSVLLTSLKEVVDALNSAITDVSYHLGEIAKGNLTTTVTRQYKGDFVPLETSTKGIIASLNDAMSQIEQSAQQVAGGSDQVACGAQALSQGATEQASSIEELSATIAEVSHQIKNNARNALEAEQLSSQSGKEVLDSNEQMQTMISAMSEISNTSNEISKIIKTIDDIAFQTNILALNAAVEAARAGAAGKGFAVVADEVRNLASKSAEAAKNTTVLIESSINAVGKGTKIADQTAKSLLSVVDGAKKSAELIGQIAAASNEQASAVTQINQGIEQISSVIQTNSATSEESAAASEELSGQAQILKDLVRHFKLKRHSESTLSSHSEGFGGIQKEGYSAIVATSEMHGASGFHSDKY